MTTLDKYVEARIRGIFSDLVEGVGNGRVEVDDPGIAAAILLGLVYAQGAMIRAWRAYLDEVPGQEAQP